MIRNNVHVKVIGHQPFATQMVSWPIIQGHFEIIASNPTRCMSKPSAGNTWNMPSIHVSHVSQVQDTPTKYIRIFF